jgi:EAL domain-containing protein (putative c-di-GMP-specific phosphodiesterase class I)
MEDISDRSSKSREVLDTIIALGRVLELRVTAEGVETCAQADALRELKCDQLQGFLFGRPQPATEVAATILRGVATKGQAKLETAAQPRSDAA